MFNPSAPAHLAWGRHLTASLLIITALLLGTSTSSRAQSTPPLAINSVPPTQANTTANLAATQTVEGTVQFHGTYCMGVAPTPEMIDYIYTPWVDATRTLYITQVFINGKQITQLPLTAAEAQQKGVKVKVVAQFQTDSTGHFSLQLPPGTYHLVLEPKMAVCKFYTVGMNTYEPLTLNVQKGDDLPAEMLLNLGCSYTKPNGAH